MAGVTRLELATFCVTGRRSNQLSYTPAYFFVISSFSIIYYLYYNFNYVNFMVGAEGLGHLGATYASSTPLIRLSRASCALF